MKSTNSKSFLGLGLLSLALVTCAAVWWGYDHLTTLVQARLKVLAGPDISVVKVTARWNRIELDQVKIARLPKTLEFSLTLLIV